MPIHYSVMMKIAFPVLLMVSILLTLNRDVHLILTRISVILQFYKETAIERLDNLGWATCDDGAETSLSITVLL